MRWSVCEKSARGGRGKLVGLPLSSASCDTFGMKFIILNNVMQMKDRSAGALGSIHLRFCTREM